jgi:Fe-S-cluster containining protein
MGDDLPPVPPDLLDELHRLAAQLLAREDFDDLARKFEWLLDALVMRGQLPASYHRLASKIRGERSTVRLTLVTEKRLKTGPEIDCASRIHLCEARCCRFEVALSKQDIADGLPWDFEAPYMLSHDPYTKKCACMDEGGSCTVYEKRPASCRVYDCRHDPRVWVDFDARIPAPMPPKITPIPRPE